MGTGKTAVSRILAKRYDKTVIEMDEWIERQEGIAISEIFSGKGEHYFRKMEKDLVQDLSRKEDMIISTGGGVVLDPENISLLEKNGFCVCLKASPEEILMRTAEESHRPLLAVKDPLKRIMSILEERKHLYDTIPYSVETDGISVMEVADCICAMYENMPEGIR